MESIDKRIFTLVNGINKYVKMEIGGIFTGKKFIPKIVIHGLNSIELPLAVTAGQYRHRSSGGDLGAAAGEVDYVDLIKETINSKFYNINVFFENLKPILKRTYENDELLPGDFFDGAECYRCPNSSRPTGGCYEINESYEIFRKNNYYWRIELFESIKYKTNSNIKNCFNNFLIGLKNKINPHWYTLIKSLKKNMYNKIKIFDDYPSESKLSWLFQPIVDICLLVKLLNTFDSFANNSPLSTSDRVPLRGHGSQKPASTTSKAGEAWSIYHVIIVSKNLDKRINSLISFFGGKISYSYATNSINTLVPTLRSRYGKKFIL